MNAECRAPTLAAIVYRQVGGAPLTRARRFALVWGAAGMLVVDACGAMDLTVAYRLALERDARLAVAYAELKAAQQEQYLAKADLLPNVQARISTTRTSQDARYGGDQQDVQQYPFRNRTDAITLTQPIVRVAALHSYRAGILRADQAEFVYRAALNDLIVRLCDAYFNVVYTTEARRFLVAQRDATKERLNALEKAREQGLATIVEVREAAARLDLVVSEETAALSAQRLAQAALAKIVGEPIKSVRMLAGSAVELAIEPDEIGAWESRASAANLGVQAAEVGVEVARKRLSAAIAEHLPTVDVNASLTRQRETGTLTSRLSSRSQFSQIGVSVNIPIYEGGRNTARQRQALAELERAQSNLDVTRRDAVSQAADAYLRFVNASVQARALEAAADSSRLALVAAQRSQQLGLRTVLDVLDADRQLQQILRDRLKAYLDRLNARLQLKAASGSLQEADVIEVAQRLTVTLDNSLASAVFSLPRVMRQAPLEAPVAISGEAQSVLKPAFLDR